MHLSILSLDCITHCFDCCQRHFCKVVDLVDSVSNYIFIIRLLKSASSMHNQRDIYCCSDLVQSLKVKFRCSFVNSVNSTNCNGKCIYVCFFYKLYSIFHFGIAAFICNSTVESSFCSGNMSDFCFYG